VGKFAPHTKGGKTFSGSSSEKFEKQNDAQGHHRELRNGKTKSPLEKGLGGGKNDPQEKERGNNVSKPGKIKRQWGGRYP